MAQQSGSKLLPAYLIVGEDSLKREEVVRRLTDRVSKLGDLEFNHQVFDGEQGAEGQAVVEAANTLPFMSDVRLVTVKNVEKLNKDSTEQIVAYLADPNPTTVLALVAVKLAKNTRLYKAAANVGPHAVISCAPKKARELPALVSKMASSHGVTMDGRAAARLVELLGEDTVRLDAEVKKLADVVRARGAGRVEVADVDALVDRVSEVKPWDLTAALSERDAARCARLISQVRDQSWLGLLSWCVSRLRELVCAKALERRGEPGRLAEEVKRFNPRAQAWQLKNHRRWASKFTARELRDALDSAAETERRMKTGADPAVAFEMWALGVCGPARETVRR